MMLVAILAVAGSACGGGDEPTSQSGKLTTVQFAQVLGVAQDVGFTQGEIEKLASEMNKVQESGGWTQQKVEKLVDDIRAAKTTAGAVSQPVSSQATTTTKQTVAPTKAATTVPTTTQPTVAPTQKPAPTKAAPPPPSLRRPCPQGQTCSFSAGEPVVGYQINIGNLQYGYACYLDAAPGPGTVTDGSVHPDPGEILRSCPAGVEDLTTVNGKKNRGSGPFAAGEAVAGWKITIGRDTYSLCYFEVAPGDGTVEDGVVNPRPDQTLARCGQPVPQATPTPARPDTVNGLVRRDGCTPKTPCPFSAGEAVTGYFSMNGKDYPNCFILKTNYGGIVTDGAVNPTKGEIAGSC